MPDSSNQLAGPEAGLALAFAPSPLPASDERMAAADVLARLKGGAIWVVGARVAGVGVSLLLSVVLARHLVDPADFGSFALLSSVIAFASGLAALGLGGAVVRFVPESRARGNTGRARDALWRAFALLALSWPLLAGGVWLVWPLLADWLKLPSDNSYAAIVAISLGLLALVQLSSDGLRSLHDMRLASLLSGGQSGGLLCNLALLAVLAAISLGGKLTLTGTLLVNIGVLAAIVPLALLALSVMSRRELAVQPVVAPGPRLEWKILLTTCLPLLLVQCVTFASTQGDLWIAGSLCPHDDLALYAAARRLVLLIVMPLQMANYLVISSIAELHAQHRLGELERLLRRTASWAALPSLAALGLLLLLGGPVLGGLFGPFYRGAAWPLALLTIGQLVLTWAGSSHTTLLMTGHQNEALAVNSMAALLLAGGGWLAARFFGISGLALTYTVVVALESMVLIVLCRRLTGVRATASLSLLLESCRLVRM